MTIPPGAAVDDPRPVARGRSFLRASLSVGTWTLASRATGFVRLAAIGAVLGPTYLGNLFQTANQLPNLAFELVAGQLIASLLLPALVGHLDRGDRAASERVAGGFLGVVLVAFTAVAAALALAGPLVAGLLSFGVQDTDTRSRLVAVGWPLIAVVTPQLALYGYIGVANAVQNARHRFALAAAAPVVENAVVTAAVITFGRRVGGGTDVTAVRTADLVWLGVACTGGVALHAALQWWGARRVGVRLRPRAGWRDGEVRAIVRLAVPSMGLAALNAAQTFACLVVVGAVAGGVVAFQLGLAFVATAVALGARPLAVAALPDLARRAAAGDLRGFRATWDRTVSVSILVLVPAAAGLAALAPALGRLLGVGAMAADDAVLLLACALAGLAIAVLGEGLTGVANQAAYTRRDGRSPLQGAIVRTALLTAGLGMAMRLDDPALVVGGVGVAYGLATVLSAWYVSRAVVQPLPTGAPLGRQVAETAAVAAASAVPAGLLAALLLGAPGVWGRVLPAAVGGAAFAAGYLGAQQFLAHLIGRPPLLQRLRDGQGAMAANGAASAHAGAGTGGTGTAAAGTPGAVDAATASPHRPAALARRSVRAAAPVLLLAAAAVGPSLARGDGRWFVISAAALLVVLSAARPEPAVLALAAAAPVAATTDLVLDTALATVLVSAVTAGVVVAGMAGRARRDIAWRMRLGPIGWAAVFGAALLTIAAGLFAGETAPGVRLAAILIGMAWSATEGLRSFAALRRAARLTVVATVGCVPVVPLLALVTDLGHPPTIDVVGVVAAPVAALAGLALTVACRRQRRSATVAVVALAAAPSAAGGWLAIIPVTVGLWLAVRSWPTAHPAVPGADGPPSSVRGMHRSAGLLDPGVSPPAPAGGPPRRRDVVTPAG